MEINEMERQTIPWRTSGKGGGTKHKVDRIG